METLDGGTQRKPLTPSRSIPLKHFDIEVKPERAAEERLPFNRKVGLLTMGPRRVTGRARKFFALCECGARVEGTALELLRMIDRGLGCGQDDCSAVSFKDVVWGRTDESVRIQLFILLRVCPEEVQSLWGGTLDDMWQPTFDEAAATLEHYLHADEWPESSVWLARLNPDLPFMEGNVGLSRKPDDALKRMASKAIDVGGQDMSLRELCQVTGLELPDLMLRIYRIGETDSLLERLLNWEDQ